MVHLQIKSKVSKIQGRRIQIPDFFLAGIRKFSLEHDKHGYMGFKHEYNFNASK